jgi:hypothetical protein
LILFFSRAGGQELLGPAGPPRPWGTQEDPRPPPRRHATVVAKSRLAGLPDTAAVTTTRSTFKLDDPSRGPGRVDVRGPGLRGDPEPKIPRDPSPQKETIYVGRRCVASLAEEPLPKPPRPRQTPWGGGACLGAKQLSSRTTRTLSSGHTRELKYRF